MHVKYLLLTQHLLLNPLQQVLYVSLVPREAGEEASAGCQGSFLLAKIVQGLSSPPCRLHCAGIEQQSCLTILRLSQGSVESKHGTQITADIVQRHA